MNFLIALCLFISPIYGLSLTPIVNSTSGPIEGKITEYNSIGVYQFLGIPYAKPPVDKLRLQSPVEPDPWTDVKSVTEYGPACLQPLNELGGPMKASEDCLYLNVYVTESTFNSSSTTKRPVLFYIHSGTFTTGSGNRMTDGTPIVPLHDVILVTINYRLSAFGFLYFGSDEPRIPSNIGLRDQLLALKWVHENIAKFGGDPNSVTIFGKSAGSMAVSAHLLSPLSKGLFRRAILQSGTFHAGFHRRDLIIAESKKVYSQICPESKDILECIQSLKASEFLNGIGSLIDGRAVAFTPIIGDDFIPYDSSKVLSEGLYDNSVDLLLGVEKNEASIFMKEVDTAFFSPTFPKPISYQEALTLLGRFFDLESMDYIRELYLGPDTNNSDYIRAQFEKAYSDVIFVCPTFTFGQEYALNLGKEGGKVFAYYHTQRPATVMPHYGEWMGTFHEADVIYVFGTPLMNTGYTEKDVKLSREMMKIWTHFAEKGEVPMVGETKWQPFQENLTAMVLNVDDWGKTESKRIEFCIKEWPYLSKHNVLTRP